MRGKTPLNTHNVICYNCSCQTMWEDSCDEATAAWNRRATPALSERIIMNNKSKNAVVAREIGTALADDQCQADTCRDDHIGSWAKMILPILDQHYSTPALDSETEKLIAKAKAVVSGSGLGVATAKAAHLFELCDALQSSEQARLAMRAALELAVTTINGLAEQQAMPDDSYRSSLDIIVRAALSRNQVGGEK